MGACKDRAPWLVLPCLLLTLSGVSVLAPRQAAQAAPNAPPAAPKQAASASEDDGDGDELLEHWGNPQYAREERLQMSGMAGGGLLLGGAAFYKRRRRRKPLVTLMPEGMAENTTERRKAA